MFRAGPSAWCQLAPRVPDAAESQDRSFEALCLLVEEGLAVAGLCSDMPCVCRLPINSWPEQMLPRLLLKKLLRRDEIPYKKPMTFSTT